MLRIAAWLACTASALLLFVSAWILIPAPNGFLLPLAVGAPEVSPLLLAVAVLLASVSAAAAKRSGVARLSLICSAIAGVLCLVPIGQLPGTLARFDGAIANTTARAPERLDGDVKVTRDVPFSKADGVRLLLDVYQPPGAGRFPVILQIYGGSWQTGSRTSREWFARHFAQRGYVVVAIEYRHAPEWIWPEQIVDARTALYWISETISTFSGDPTRIVIIGRSAGAQLAMRLAYQEGPSSIRGVVNYYGPVDLTEGWRRPPNPDPLKVREIFETFIGGTPNEKAEHYRHASPITWVSRASAPTLSVYGARDHVVEARFGRMLDTALKRAGATSVLLVVPWSEHSFDAVPAGMGMHVSLAYTERFIAWAVTR